MICTSSTKLSTLPATTVKSWKSQFIFANNELIKTDADKTSNYCFDKNLNYK